MRIEDGLYSAVDLRSRPVVPPSGVKNRLKPGLQTVPSLSLWACSASGLLAGVLFCLGMIALLGAAGAADSAADLPKGEKVEYTHYSKGYFEKNNSGLKGDASFLVVTEQKMFDQFFGVGVVMGMKPTLLPADAFDTLMVLAVIRRGNAVWTYEVERVTADKDTLYVAYKATEGVAGNARFSSPMILSLKKGEYKSVVFIENGKKAAAVELK